jgi:hypothetical protein
MNLKLKFEKSLNTRGYVFGLVGGYFFSGVRLSRLNKTWKVRRFGPLPTVGILTKLSIFKGSKNDYKEQALHSPPEKRSGRK